MIRATAQRRAAVALVSVGVLALASCGSSGGVKEAADGKVTVTGKGRKATVTVRGEDGTTVTFNQRAVPGGFPREVPLPEGATLQGATSGTRDGKKFFQITSTPGSGGARAALDAYATRLGAAGLTVSRPGGSGGGAGALSADGSGWHVLALATDAGAGSLTVTVTEA